MLDVKQVSQSFNVLQPLAVGGKKRHSDTHQRYPSIHFTKQSSLIFVDKAKITPKI